MACKVYLHGDGEPLLADAPADVLVSQLMLAPQDEFLRVEMLPYSQEEAQRPAYLRPSVVVAVLPMDPREVEQLLEHAPSWLDPDDD